MAGPVGRAAGGDPGTAGAAGSARSRPAGVGRAPQRRRARSSPSHGTDPVAAGRLAPRREPPPAQWRPRPCGPAAAAGALPGRGAPPGAHPGNRRRELGSLPAAPLPPPPHRPAAGRGRQPRGPRAAAAERHAAGGLGRSLADARSHRRSGRAGDQPADLLRLGRLRPLAAAVGAGRRTGGAAQLEAGPRWPSGGHRRRQPPPLGRPQPGGASLLPAARLAGWHPALLAAPSGPRLSVQRRLRGSGLPGPKGR